MDQYVDQYQALKYYRDRHIINHVSNLDALNHSHDMIMERVLQIALDRLKEDKGPPPASFSWFVMGSAGRSEQSAVSDQDHGLLYEGNGEECRDYFSSLGKVITDGLQIAGYPYCEGKVMSCNPLWCKSEVKWKDQLMGWMEEESWESIRYLLIFYDARVLAGREEPVQILKQMILQYIERYPHFLQRLLDNTMRIKKGVGLFHQLLTETHGPHKGSILLKECGLFPYINAARILAIKEKKTEPSTLSRFEQLTQYPQYEQEMRRQQANFRKLLDYKLMQVEHHTGYEMAHYLDVSKLDRNQISDLKRLLLDGVRLHRFTQRVIQKG